MASGPRERTRLHLQKLLAVAAASASIGGSCHHENGSSSGYGVVDPMPPPTRCPRLAELFRVVTKPGSPGMISVEITKPASRPDVSFLDAPNRSTDGKPVTAELAVEVLKLDVPLATQGSISVPFDVQCSAGTANMLVVVEKSDAGPSAILRDANSF